MPVGKKLIDIGANLIDTMYQGVYHGSKKHEPDLEQVLHRAWASGLTKIIITGTSLEESKRAVEIAKTNDNLYCSVGCHPTNCNELSNSESPDTYLQDMANLIKNNVDKVVAIGEVGLDYDRLHFCEKETQIRWFEAQLVALAPLGLPLFLHCRNAAQDFLSVVQKNASLWSDRGGVVHSFDGTKEEAESFLNAGFYIGINGCSLKTKENLEVVATLPVDRLLLETDSPWCDVRPAHAGASLIKMTSPYTSVKKEKWRADAMVKGRNEPCNIGQVLDIISAVKQQDSEILAQQIYLNTKRLFFTSEK